MAPSLGENSSVSAGKENYEHQQDDADTAERQDPGRENDFHLPILLE